MLLRDSLEENKFNLVNNLCRVTPTISTYSKEGIKKIADNDQERGRVQEYFIIYTVYPKKICS